jgi:hypothetical protein
MIGGCGVNSSGTGKKPVTGYGGHVNELFGFIKVEDFSDR